MRFYVTGKADPDSDIVIESLTLTTADNKEHLIEYDEADIDRNDDGTFDMRAKGILIDGSYGNEHLQELKNTEITNLEASASIVSDEIQIDTLIFEDGNDQYAVTKNMPFLADEDIDWIDD